MKFDQVSPPLSELAQRSTKVTADVTIRVEIDPKDFDSYSDMEWALFWAVLRHAEQSNNADEFYEKAHYAVYFYSGTVSSLD